MLHDTPTPEKGQKGPAREFICGCGKVYKHKQSLFKHAKNCEKFEKIEKIEKNEKNEKNEKFEKFEKDEIINEISNNEVTLSNNLIINLYISSIIY